jgi:flavin-dependent dehydrogenase
MLSSAKVIKKTACMATAFSPLKTPFTGNILVIGDAAAYVEVEVQGALSCGFRAGNAVAEELNGSAGFEEYSRWWRESFEFNGDDYLQVAQGFALVPTYSDDELDYLFSLIEDETLPGTFSQYVTPKLMWKSILNHQDRIIKERPDIHEKIKNNNQLTLGDVL